MTNDLINTIENLPITGFVWRDRKGKEYHPTLMDDQHLFYTVRMIWNHSMPDKVKLHPYNKYSFRAFYTTEYMKAAIMCLLPELLNRNPSTWPNTHKRELDKMKACFAEKHKYLVLL